MARLGRPGMSDAQKRELWERWGDGQTISEIGRVVGRAPGSIFSVLRTTGGYVPSQRSRRESFLTVDDREEISRGLARGDSFRAIAITLGRPPSTVCREVNRNGGREQYRAASADEAAWNRARRPKPCLLALDPLLAGFVRDRLAEQWSPQQISGRLASRPLEGRTVSHETIYKTLYVESRKVFERGLTKNLRTRRPIRRNKKNTTKGQHRSRIKGAVSIHYRPPEAESRKVPGHWEGDLILGRGVTQMATIVDRSSRYTVLVQLDGRDKDTVAERLAVELAGLPESIRRTLTWDRGMELADHQRVTAATGIDIYFADARSPWQRGTNENTNGLLRQYYPKGTSMAGLTQDDLNRVATLLNNRPRKALGYNTPADTLQEALR